MSRTWALELSLRGPCGENYAIAIPLDEHTVQERLVGLNPPTFPAMSAFTETVELMKRREFRKYVFTQEAQRLGKMLAERMEDKEGWHGIDREEKLRDWGR